MSNTSTVANAQAAASTSADSNADKNANKDENEGDEMNDYDMPDAKTKNMTNQQLDQGSLLACGGVSLLVICSDRRVSLALTFCIRYSRTANVESNFGPVVDGSKLFFSSFTAYLNELDVVAFFSKSTKTQTKCV